MEDVIKMTTNASAENVVNTMTITRDTNIEMFCNVESAATSSSCDDVCVDVVNAMTRVEQHYKKIALAVRTQFSSDKYLTNHIC